ncbi:hypothetical protein SAMN05216516_110114 [Izhakiella capsodis]|uniref:Uncharacterized protein n=1 Tax=Izhakiella capsodis TaxID=1367852 RepID=A0A1I5A2K6_9GAMM|nr:hypothetical protein SAMN05216516_110114 [Izhakiella capsodis]
MLYLTDNQYSHWRKRCAFRHYSITFNHCLRHFRDGVIASCKLNDQLKKGYSYSVTYLLVIVYLLISRNLTHCMHVLIIMVAVIVSLRRFLMIARVNSISAIMILMECRTLILNKRYFSLYRYGINSPGRYIDGHSSFQLYVIPSGGNDVTHYYSASYYEKVS